MAKDPFAPRSLLFVPGSRPDMIAKLFRWTADAAVIDLEDAVPVAGKEAARQAGVAAAADLDLPGTAVLVRVNPAGSPWFRDDLRAVAAAASGGAVAGVVLPKCVSSAELVEARAEIPGALIVAGLETAAGVAGCRGLLARDVDAAYFGAEDYIADLGGRRTPEGDEVLYARSRVALAARLSGVAAIDQVVTDVRDAAAFERDAEKGRSIGYRGKLCIHPAQVPIANAVFGATPEEVDRARRLIAAWEEAAARGVGAVRFEGEMVDEPILRMARDTLERAGTGA
jgi:citrate lyase subunit beta / citryl-CoA lyase